MEAPEAVRQAEAHLKNALELVPRPVGKADLLYMWDNQITALDNFLAETESLRDDRLAELRTELRDAKKKLTDAVVAFEAKEEGVEIDEGDASDDEWVQVYLDGAGEMTSLIAEALEEPVRDIKDLPRWEEPLAVVNGYLADSEPYQDGNHELRKARSVVRIARRDLKDRIDEVFQHWRAHQDEDEGDD